MKLTELPLTCVWHALGGGVLRGKRARAFWRDGDGYSVSLDPVNNRWFDFRENVGGGVLALTQTALDCDRGKALSWLEQHCGLDSQRPFPPEHRQRWARAASRAPALARRLADFDNGLWLICEWRLQVAHTANIDPGAVAHWHKSANHLRQATASEIARYWSESDPEWRGKIEKIGRSDCEHAEAITDAIVSILESVTRAVRAA